VDVTPEARRHLDRLPDRLRGAVLAAIFDAIAVNPRRAGKPLRGELEGLHSARRGDFRIIYEVIEAERTVVIHRAARRNDVYRPR